MNSSTFTVQRGAHKVTLRYADVVMFTVDDVYVVAHMVDGSKAYLKAHIRLRYLVPSLPSGFVSCRAGLTVAVQHIQAFRDGSRNTGRGAFVTVRGEEHRVTEPLRKGVLLAIAEHKVECARLAGETARRRGLAKIPDCVSATLNAWWLAGYNDADLAAQR